MPQNETINYPRSRPEAKNTGVSIVVRLPREVAMIWELKDKGVVRPRELPDHIERRLRFAIARFQGRVEKVLVFLHDHNGPKGGIDKVCRILVKTRGCGSVIAAVVDSDWFVAVDRATTRIGHSLGRHIERIREQTGSRLHGLRGVSQA
jgi:putative sigma-54 modulation protein